MTICAIHPLANTMICLECSTVKIAELEARIAELEDALRDIADSYCPDPCMGGCASCQAKEALERETE